MNESGFFSGAANAVRKAGCKSLCVAVGVETSAVMRGPRRLPGRHFPHRLRQVQVGVAVPLDEPLYIRRAVQRLPGGVWQYTLGRPFAACGQAETANEQQ